VVPGSFSGCTLEQATAPSHLLQSFTYFSFITLTTLGAGGLCQAEAIVGQFYTTVLVANLVGMYSSERDAQKEKVKSILIKADAKNFTVPVGTIIIKG
jgi:voltage-gated potassium channel